MGKNTNIQWADHTFNGIRGCSKVHTGCKNCYAETNIGVKMHGIKWGTEKQGGTRVVASEATWAEPRKWNILSRCERNIWELLKEGCNTIKKLAAELCDPEIEEWLIRMKDRGVIKFQSRKWVPRRWRNQTVFAYSLGDVFENWEGPIVDHKGEQVFLDDDGGIPVTMHDVRKRLFNTIDCTPNLDWLILTKRPENIIGMIDDIGAPDHVSVDWQQDGSERTWLRRNLWLGTSVSDQATAGKAIPHLLKCDGLAQKLFLSIEPLVGPIDASHWLNRGIDWTIVGGESGNSARACNIGWIESLVKQCAANDVPCFVKQVGSHIRLEHSKGGNPAEWPESIRVQELPA